jgi:hypothetical protein
MLLPDLIRIVQGHAETLAAELIDSLRRDPGVSYLHTVGDDELRRRMQDLYRNCAQWTVAAQAGGGRQQQDVDRSYMDLGRLRRDQGIPANQIVRALHRAKTHLLDFIRRNAAADSSVEIYQETELEATIHGFFDSAVEHVLRGYEADPPGPPLTVHIIAARARAGQTE